MNNKLHGPGLIVYNLRRIYHLQKLFDKWGESDTHYSALTLTYSPHATWLLELEVQGTHQYTSFESADIGKTVEDAIAYLEKVS